jgi:TPR repeat protein
MGEPAPHYQSLFRVPELNQQQISQQSELQKFFNGVAPGQIGHFGLANDQLDVKQEADEQKGNPENPTISRLRTRGLDRVWKGKYGKGQPTYTPVAPKKQGAFPGAIYEKAHTTPYNKPGVPPKRWVGKVGSYNPESNLNSAGNSAQRRSISRDAIKEKIAFDCYTLIADASDAAYLVPKCRLAKLPIINNFTHHHPQAIQMNTALAMRYPTVDGKPSLHIHIMSKLVAGYKDLKEAIVFNSQGERRDFMQHFRETGVFATHIFENNELIPLRGLPELLAASRLLGDIDVLGDTGENAGYTLFQSNDGKPYAQIVKVDPGFAFTFEPIPNRFYANIHAPRTVAEKLQQRPLDNPCDIQFGARAGSAIAWDKLNASQQEDFLRALQAGIDLLQHEPVLDYLLIRHNQFNQGANEELFKPELINQYRAAIIENIKLQAKCYSEPLKTWLAKQEIATFAAQQKQTLNAPWRVDKASQAKHKKVKSFSLLDATEADLNKVAALYLKSPVPGYSIKKVQVIYNPLLEKAFANNLGLLNKRHDNLAFIAKWRQQGHEPADVQDHRQATHDLLFTKKMVESHHRDPNAPHVMLLPLWHTTNETILDSLFTTGFANLATVDSGYFGKGLYSAGEAAYSYGVYGKMYQRSALLMNWVAAYSVYPVIDGDKPKLQGQGNYGNHDAHFIPVVPRDPNNPDEVDFLPCIPKQPHKYTEMVVFEKAQCIPRYWVELQADLLPSPAQDNVSLQQQLALPSPPPQEPEEQKKYELTSPIKKASTRSRKKNFCATLFAAATTAAVIAVRGFARTGQGEILHVTAPVATGAGRNFNLENSEEYFSSPTFSAAYPYYLSPPEATLYSIGEDHFEHGRAAQAYEHFQRAAELDYPPAYLRLHNLLKYNYIAKNSQQEAHWKDLASREIDWFHWAAKSGQADAQHNLGYCYLHGIGVEKNEIEGMRWFRLAAEQGLAIAQNWLGYINLFSIAENKIEAVRWFRLAAEQGLAIAQSNLGYCYLNGLGDLPHDAVIAAQYFLSAAQQGNAYGQNWLGSCYLKGLGVKEDKGEAVRLLRLAAEQGLATAQSCLGSCYLKGLGVEENKGEAIRLFRLAAEQGLAQAQSWLGHCYLNGEGLEKNIETARQWFCLAAAQGEETAKVTLKNFKLSCN